MYILEVLQSGPPRLAPSRGCHLKSQQLLEQPLEDHPQKGHQQRHHLAWHVSGDGKDMCCCGDDLHELVFFRMSDYMIFYAL